MSKSKQEKEQNESSGSGTRIACSVGIAVALVAGYVGYEYGIGLAWTVAYVCLGFAIIMLISSIVLSLRGRGRGRMATFLKGLPGPEWSQWNPETGIRSASKFKAGIPRSVVLSYPSGLPDHSQEWRGEFEKQVRQRMGTDSIRASWNQKKSRVQLVGYDKKQSQTEIMRGRITERCVAVFKPFFRAVHLNVEVSAWDADDELKPARIDLSYGVISQDGSELWQRKIEAMAGLKLGGRWRGNFDPVEDKAYLEPRPALPTNVIHPGVGIYKNLTPTQRANPVLFYGVDEEGNPRGWQIGQKSTMPHMLCAGPTGGGKTTVLRSLLVGAVAQGIPVYACDPKMIELTPFYGFPGVWIASTPEEMAAMIESMEKLMYDRYDEIKKNPRAADSMTPVLFILDELLILRQVLKRYWARPKEDEDGKMKKGTGQPPWFEAISGLLALSRSAKVNLVIGVQRPDATLFDEGSRDNLRQRISLMRLSPQGSQMMWGSAFVGIDLPMVQGRAMASPDGETAVEIQTFWIADPVTAEGQDKEVIESFRTVAADLFNRYESPIDVSLFEGAMPTLDRAALEKVNKAANEAPAEAPVETGSGLLEASVADVNADSLVEGDTIILESGDHAEVLEVGEDPFDENGVLLTLQSDGGTEEVTFDGSERVSRVQDFADAQ